MSDISTTGRQHNKPSDDGNPFTTDRRPGRQARAVRNETGWFTCIKFASIKNLCRKPTPLAQSLAGDLRQISHGSEEIADLCVHKAIQQLSEEKRPESEEVYSAFSPMSDVSETDAFKVGLVGKAKLNADALKKEILKSSFLALGEFHGASHNNAIALEALKVVKDAGKKPVVLIEWSSSDPKFDSDSDILMKVLGTISFSNIINQIREVNDISDREDLTPHQKASLIMYIESKGGLAEQYLEEGVDETYYDMLLRYMGDFFFESPKGELSKSTIDRNLHQNLNERYYFYRHCFENNIPIRFIEPFKFETSAKTTHLSMADSVLKSISAAWEYPVLMCGMAHAINNQKEVGDVSQRSRNLAERWNGVTVLSGATFKALGKSCRVSDVNCDLRRIGEISIKNVAPSSVKNEERELLTEYRSPVFAIRTKEHIKLLDDASEEKPDSEKKLNLRLKEEKKRLRDEIELYSDQPGTMFLTPDPQKNHGR